jgi:hypothetical protein
MPDMLPMLMIEPEQRSRMLAPTAREVFQSARTLRRQDHECPIMPHYAE